MDAKIIGFLAALFACIGLTYFIHEAMSVDAANTSLEEARQYEATLQDQLKYHLSLLDMRKDASALISANELMQREITKLQAEIDKAQQTLLQTEKDFDRYVAGKRQETIGAEMGEMQLSNGSVLKGVRVQKIEGTFTTVSHSEGITKLPAHLLPEKLQERFRFGLADAKETAPPPQNATSRVTAADPRSAAIKSSLSNLEQLQKQLRSIQSEYYRAESEAASGASASKRFYAKKRVGEIAQQIADMKRRISDAEANLSQEENKQ